jgi:hypothetical protein
MDRSFALQQQQLMRMNIMRESQRMMLTQAETIVRLNQLREGVIKALPPKNVKVVIPTSNAALEETLSSTKGTQTQVVMEEEGKPAPPTKVRSAPASLAGSPKQRNLMVEVEQAVKSGLSPRQVRAAADAARAANKPSPTASQAPTVASSQDPSLLSTDSNQPGSPRDDDLDISVHFGRERKLLKDAVKRSGAREGGMSEISQGKALAAIKEAKSVAELKAIENELINGKSKFQAADLIGNGLMRLRAKSSGSGLKRLRAKSGRFVKSKR